ncbi:hypothetical protein J3R30DRAFT_3697906 [Lentinula aciculospora]|uniref:Uncharacterized protein n=1 Tax=Lentinula aciculospora TaxID=153920 RepID=A0A9W9AMF7_9AGAR|nr:hypothetical protein J3R30DRAFT_3697906 [Lentinula aciculospora]
MTFSSTLIIIIIVISVTVLVLLLVSYMFWSKSKRKIPLPPVQPLAHERERSVYALAAEKEREQSMFLQIQIAPSWSEVGTIKSAVSSQSGSTVNTVTHPSMPPLPPMPPGISLANRHAPPRPLSLASSARTSRSNLSRAIPHAVDSNVQIVLPAPLGVSTMDYSRNSVADGWVSRAGNESQPSRSRSRSGARSLSRSHSRSSSSQSYNFSRPNPSPPDSFVRNRSRTNSLPYSTSPHEVLPVPHMSSRHPSVPQIHPPPVPLIPSTYRQPSVNLLTSHLDAVNAELGPGTRK